MKVFVTSFVLPFKNDTSGSNMVNKEQLLFLSMKKVWFGIVNFVNLYENLSLYLLKIKMAISRLRRFTYSFLLSFFIVYTMIVTLCIVPYLYIQYIWMANGYHFHWDKMWKRKSSFRGMSFFAFVLYPFDWRVNFCSSLFVNF